MIVYVDTSVLAGIILGEPGCQGAMPWIKQHKVRLVTCDLTATELMRAVRRSNPDKAPAVQAMLRRCAIIRLDASIYAEAGRLEPRELRSLDAIHLASALHLGSQLDGMLSYDSRLTEAAERVGIRAVKIA